MQIFQIAYFTNSILDRQVHFRMSNISSQEVECAHVPGYHFSLVLIGENKTEQQKEQKFNSTDSYKLRSDTCNSLSLLSGFQHQQKEKWEVNQDRGEGKCPSNFYLVEVKNLPVFCWEKSEKRRFCVSSVLGK